MLKKKPVTGMKDILPEEMAIRSYVMREVRSVYQSFGFTELETPVVEHIENLSSNQGGENEKLIFRILKRGEKLDLEHAATQADLVDAGLRYDLTLPLSRYYAANMQSLPSPFKALQMGNVFRADRPQRGRFRQFMQCDIDILGEGSELAEIELILATTTLLKRLGFRDFTVRLSDRRLLTALAKKSGFPEEEFDRVFIILDKLDKIGAEGVKEELLKADLKEEAVDRCLSLFRESAGDEASLAAFCSALGDALPEGVKASLLSIMQSVSAASDGGFSLRFDPVLVRGMSYYTGTIFEIEMADFGSSVAGGGRYDDMIGRFSGQPTPACGFSIGFERIITILAEQHFQVPREGKRIAFLLDKNLSGERVAGIMKEAMALREEGNTVCVARMKKNKRFQKDTLETEGYQEIRDFFE